MGRLIRILALVSAGVLGLTACGTTTSSGKIGGTVHILGTWTGTEKDSFDAVMKPFTDQTGVKISFEATRDLDAILQTKIAAGNPPDVTGAPGVGTLIKLARAGKLVALDDKLDVSQLNANYGADWINLGKIDNKLYTLYAWAALKGLIWYDPKAFQAKGYQVPKTWDELMTLQNKIKSDGGKPWCVALESKAASGWPGSDWHKEIVLSQSGTTIYDNWWQGKQKWTSPEIKQAWTTWGQILGSATATSTAASNTWSQPPSATEARASSPARPSATCSTRVRSSPAFSTPTLPSPPRGRTMRSFRCLT